MFGGRRPRALARWPRPGVDIRHAGGPHPPPPPNTLGRPPAHATMPIRRCGFAPRAARRTPSEAHRRRAAAAHECAQAAGEPLPLSCHAPNHPAARSATRAARVRHRRERSRRRPPDSDANLGSGQRSRTETGDHRRTTSAKPASRTSMKIERALERIRMPKSPRFGWSA
jgi:hypothetical protein